MQIFRLSMKKYIKKFYLLNFILTLDLLKRPTPPYLRVNPSKKTHPTSNIPSNNQTPFFYELPGYLLLAIL